MSPKKEAAKRKLDRLVARHDKLEREILILCRKFTDKELQAMGMAAGG